MRFVLTNIKLLAGIEREGHHRDKVYGAEMKQLDSIDNAWLLIEDHRIKAFGSMNDWREEFHTDNIMDVDGKMVLPAWVDSHTHLVFAAPREQEFVDRINGLSYEEIANRGGGILNSAKAMEAMDEDELFDMCLHRLQHVMHLGTGAIEIKSGYGLNLKSEMKMLRVIRKLKEYVEIPIKASFLAAHTYPLEYRQNHQGYIDVINKEMLPKMVDEGLADYIDVFCEEGFFSVDEAQQIIEAGAHYGLKAKIHANQLHRSGGVQLGVKNNVISVDHLECMGDAEIEALQHSNTIPTLLPGAAFFLGMPYQPARALLDAGLPVAIASDYNPGSCPSGNMNFILSLACTQLKMTPEEAINAQTLNGAAALELQHELGTIAIGKRANLIITKPIPSLAYLPYSFGENLIDGVIIEGKKI